MTRGDEKQERISANRTDLQGRFLGLLADEPECRPPLFDILDDRAAIRDRGSHMHLGMFRTERGEERREEALARYRACRDRQVTGDRWTEATQVAACLFVKIEDLAGELVEAMTGFGEGNFSGPTVEERNPQLPFQRSDPLTHGRLSDTQVGRRSREAPF